jgi:hypothetical protein
MAWAQLDHAGIPTRTILEPWRDVIKQLPYRFCIAKASCNQATGMDHLGIASLVTNLSQGDQSFCLSPYRFSFSTRGANTLMFKQLFDQVSP